MGAGTKTSNHFGTETGMGIGRRECEEMVRESSTIAAESKAVLVGLYDARTDDMHCHALPCVSLYTGSQSACLRASMPACYLRSDVNHRHAAQLSTPISDSIYSTQAGVSARWKYR